MQFKWQWHYSPEYMNYVRFSQSALSADNVNIVNITELPKQTPSVENGKYHTLYTCLTVFGWKKLFAYHIPWWMDSAICNALTFFVGFPLLKFTVVVGHKPMQRKVYHLPTATIFSQKHNRLFDLFPSNGLNNSGVFTQTEELKFATDDK